MATGTVFARNFMPRALFTIILWSVGVIVLLVWMRMRTQTEEAARCDANLQAIGMAMDQYVNKYGEFPPPYVADPLGHRLHSWRILLLEFLDPPTHAQYNFAEPWNSPGNLRLASKMPRVYACPCLASQPDVSRTSYAVIVGPESVFPEGGGRRLAQIPDSEDHEALAGTPASVFVVVEASKLNLIWLEPRDLVQAEMSLVLNDIHSDKCISICHPGGSVGLLLTDGTDRRTKMSSTEINRMMSIRR